MAAVVKKENKFVNLTAVGNVYPFICSVGDHFREIVSSIYIATNLQDVSGKLNFEA